MNTRTIEILVGLFVAGAMAALFMLSLKVSNLTSYGNDNGYHLKANFENIGGLKVRAPVSAGGVRVGQVTDISYNNESYVAVVTFSVEAQYRFPKDTAANILTAGLLGEQYIGLEPGGDEEYLQEGDSIDLTQPALVLEQVIGQFLYSKAAEE
ncbi:MAG: outer membrane lipid asymmetry maintenance protein MlaD [Gammaproteobacteria bacterium]|nr:MAG: outer membrane lipid asymmetry maintenance protein MlaD [Gammaproteobacteria bacterium]